MSRTSSNGTECILVVYDLRDPDACSDLHAQRAVWQVCSEIEALDDDHFLLIVRPGGTISGEGGREAA